ncbi:MAG: OmpA family protein, partial [Gammaproteobacteria bacterium]|nr:OmpA family protein [Gammaproteobacteria bacterium]
ANVVSQAVIYEDVIKELRQSLLGEFNPDMKKWNAELRDDLTFRFNEPSVLFDVGKTTIKPKFKRILDDFFPRYLRVITSNKFKADIAEVRIEGHTSSFWGSLDPRSQQAYFNNMELSQGRSRNVLFYVTQLPTAEERIEWLRDKLTANGLSSSKLVDSDGYLLTDKESNGVENRARSQRVEFRVRIDAESKITKIIDSGNSEKQ